MKRTHYLQTLPAFLVVFLFSGCVYYPTTDEHYHNCTLVTKRLKIDHVEVNAIPSSCKDEECTAVVIIYLGVPATTFVVSGSIVVMGNVLHWMEKEGTCKDGFVRATLDDLLEALEQPENDSESSD